MNSISINSISKSAQLADPKQEPQTACLGCCAVMETRTAKTEKLPLKKSVKQASQPIRAQKPTADQPLIVSANN
jgi:hypothetical protein